MKNVIMKFPHKCPEGFKYETDQFSKTVIRIWIRNCKYEFVGCSDPHPKSVWGFFCQKTKQFKAPIHKDKIGKIGPKISSFIISESI